MMSLRHGWGWQPTQTASCIYPGHIQCVSAHWRAPSTSLTLSPVAPSPSSSVVPSPFSCAVAIIKAIDCRRCTVTHCTVTIVVVAVACCAVAIIVVVVWWRRRDGQLRQRQWQRRDKIRLRRRWGRRDLSTIQDGWGDSFEYAKCHGWHYVAVCCQASYTVIPTLLGSDFWVLVHMCSQDDVIASWLRLTANSNCFLHLSCTHTMCFSTLICCP